MTKQNFPTGQSIRIVDLRAVPISFPVPADKSVRLGIGRSVKRDSVLVRVETSDGLIGWGEAHHGRCPGQSGRRWSPLVPAQSHA